MKKTIITAAFALLIAATAAAQLMVRPSGAVRIGQCQLEDTGFLPGSMVDSTTALQVYNPLGETRQSLMSFGYTPKNTKTVMVGNEYDDGVFNRLWLQGQYGFAFTQNSHATDTIVQFLNVDNYVDFRYPVKSEGVLLTSDERCKEDIRDLDGALETLAGLRGVTYHYKARKSPYADVNVDASDPEAMKDKAYFDKYYADLEAERTARLRYGFLAQELEQVLPDLVQRDKDGMMSVDYIAVIPILVNAVNELSGELAEVKAKNEQLEQQLEAPAVNRAPAQQPSGMDQLIAGKAAEVLAQNDPNPFNSDTRIAYSLPEGTQQAAIYIYDLQGKQVRQLPVADMGAGSVTLHGGDLQAGMYIYSLIADGHELASKKMILTK